MEEPADDFFEHIKQTLRSYEEEYREGAWEAFAQKHLARPPAKTAPVITIWKWVAASAAVVAGLFLAITYFTAQPQADAPAHETVNIITPEDRSEPATGADSNQVVHPGRAPQIAQQQPPVFMNRDAWKEQENLHRPAPLYLTNASKGNPLQYGMLPISIPQKITVTPTPAQTDPEQQLTAHAPAAEFWKNRIVTDDAPPQQHQAPAMNSYPMMAQNDHPQQQESQGSRKWIPSLFLSPMFAESGVNMGYGVSLAYAINDKVRISAGVAHNKITTSRDFEAAASPAASPTLNAPGNSLSLTSRSSLLAATNVAASPRLESVQGALSGFDIPLDVSYNISKKFYATAGVSGLVVVNDNTNYTLVTSTNTRISVENSQGILQEDKSIVTNTYSSATALPGDITHDKTSFLGFYNISMGYKQKITPKNNVSIEPFLKVPVKNVTNQNLNYTGMGVRLKFDF